MPALFVPSAGRGDLEPEIVAMGTSQMLRIRRVGAVYFVENLFQERDAANAVTDRWKVVAVAKPTAEQPNARAEAFQFLHQANIETIKLSVASPRRMGDDAPGAAKSAR